MTQLQKMEMAELSKHALALADIAVETSMSFFRGRLGIEFKHDESPVTQADRAVEAALRSYIRDHCPNHGIYGEEHGSEGLELDQIWGIDPIDGTRSFLSGNPLFGTLLAHLTQGKPDIGIIGMPALGEVLLGRRGQGASNNGQPISVSQQTKLSDAILYINEGEKLFRDTPDLFAKLMTTGQTRRFGYDCYPHAMLAMGHVDVVIDYDLQPYDYLAVAAVVEAAGGIVTDWSGSRLTLESDGRIISAATPSLHRSMLSLVESLA
jgi:histidinol phosphatase-like enzyme (inositol monophosphatase family)